MGTQTTDFTAVGLGLYLLSPVFNLSAGETATYTLDGTLDATCVGYFESSPDGIHWDVASTSVAGAVAVSGTATGPGLFRFRVTSGSTAQTSALTAVIASVADILLDFKDRNGNVVLRITEAGIEVTGTQTSSSAAAALATNLTVSALFKLSGVEDTLTAHAGGTQAVALALSPTKSVHRVSVCATNADSVRLPVATVGQVHLVKNSGAATLQVYGAGTETIDDVATATGVALLAGVGAWFVCVSTGKYYMVKGA